MGPRFDLSKIYADDGYRYNSWAQSRIHQLDYDRDGRGDLVYWNADHFAVHRQDERGLFAAAAETFATEVAIGSQTQCAQMV